MVVVTNYHVVQNTVNVTVTFADGKACEASVLGYDAYEDLAVVSVDAPESELKPLRIMSSSTIEVGDPVIAVGSPYGLEGSLTTGIVSALGRTLSESMAGGYPIANVIQTSTAINPGNSGGPLLTYEGRVIGITTAIVSNSQGLGFAVPSSAILREIGSLITTGTYDQHAALGVSGTDMNYDIAKAMSVNVTYGWLIATAPSGSTLHGGTTQVIIDGNQVTIGGDIVIALNGTGIRNIDDLSSYLDANTLPGQTVNVTVVRSRQTTTLSVVLGKRSSPSSI
jgi:S1-C subfamily serine protease